MKVAVLGAKGRMGAECVAAINAASDLTLAAALDLGDSLDQLLSSGTEIVEMHHANKVDAPSGTAIRTAQMINDSRKQSGKGKMPDATKTELPGSRGSKVGEVPIHSIRSHGYVAHQEVIFGDSGETLTIRHDSINRAGFMPGVLIGIRNVSKHPGLTVGLENYMEAI